jgi:pimeloyl-ACP methyl ester carboxylesterase
MHPLRTLALLLASTAAAQTPAPPASPQLTLHDRTIAGAPARTGSFRVWENRAAAAGRVIALDVVVLPALANQPQPDPVFVFGGGPGQDITRFTDMWASHFMRQQRDIVLVSQRGAGGDNRLYCPLTGSDANQQGCLDPIFDEPTFRACCAELSKRFDLTQYSTASAVDDVNDLREALGYDKINLIGGSYGTRAELEYIRRHPQSVRLAILNGVAPVSLLNPLYHASSAQQALDRIFDDCAADPACDRAYGNLRVALKETLARLEGQPAPATVTHPSTGEPVQVSITRDAFAEALRVLMYSDRSRIPLLVRSAADGDFDAFARAGIESNRGLRDMLAFGLLLCVTCAEDVDRITDAMIARETAGAFLGDIRVRAQKTVCDFWPKSVLPEDASLPVTADVPVLMLSGLHDPVSPARFAEEAATHLARSLHVVAPGGHGLSGPCIDEIMRQAIDAGDVVGIDTSCLDNIPATGYVPPPP